MNKHFIAGCFAIAATVATALQPSITHAAPNWTTANTVETLEVVQGSTNPWVWVNMKGSALATCTDEPNATGHSYFLPLTNDVGFDSILSTLMAAELSGRPVSLSVTKYKDPSDANSKICVIERVRMQ